MKPSDIVFTGLGISHAYRDRTVLDGVSFELKRGEILALLGPNGSGKSTLLKLISGILPIARRGQAGIIKFMNKDFLSCDSFERARRIAYVPGDITSEFPVTVEEAVSLGRLCHSKKDDSEIVRWALESCGCYPLRARMLDTLSGGERQLVAMARALAQESKILLLDETFSKMDLHHQAKMGRLILDLRKKDYSFVIVSHDINLATEWSDTCLLLKGGVSVASGPVKEILTTENLRKLYPSGDISVSPSPVNGRPKVFFGGLNS